MSPEQVVRADSGLDVFVQVAEGGSIGLLRVSVGRLRIDLRGSRLFSLYKEPKAWVG
jgi:hypothetical protein